MLFLDRVLYAKKTGDEEECATTPLGGNKISVEEACVSCILLTIYWICTLIVICVKAQNTRAHNFVAKLEF